MAVLIAALAVLVGACDSKKPVDEEAIKRLHARAAYERALGYLNPPPGGGRQPALALSALQEAITLDGSEPVYRNALGLLFFELQRPDLAVEQFRKATEVDPQYADAYLNLGVGLAESRQWEGAVEAYRKAIALPTLGHRYSAYQNLGLALFHMGKNREAEEALRFAIALDQHLAAAYYNLGLLLISESRREEAVLALRRARDLEPESPFGRAAADRLRALAEGR